MTELQMSDAEEFARGQPLQVRPTLFIGVGGTGKEVLLRLRRRILQADWNDARVGSIANFPVAAFLYFDTDTAEATESDRATRDDPLAASVRFAQNEKLQAKVDIERYTGQMENYRHINAWWPHGDVRSIDTSKGAGQVRAISRLLLFDRFTTLRNSVRNQLRTLRNNVSNEDLLLRLGLDISSDQRVVVIGSAAGGTGSGCFIDIGLMLRSLQDPKPDAVDLFLLLAGGFAGKNQDRVYANTYAALMELEHVMRPDYEPPFVENWTENIGPTVKRPYSDVFMFDASNLAMQTTGNVEDVYSMMADLLFEDFGSNEFAGRKRSIAVNQAQFKTTLYYPPLPERVGGAVLGYSRSYSAVGQSTIDTRGQIRLEAASSRACARMLASFFGVAGTDARNLPRIEDRDRFIRDELSLGQQGYEDFPEYFKEPPAAIIEPALVGRLLRREDDTSIDAALRSDLAARFERMLSVVGTHREWPDQARVIQEETKRDVEGAVDGQGSRRFTEIDAAADRTLEEMLGPTGFVATLYRMLDNKESGGLDYTVKLAEMLGEAIGDTSRGEIRRLHDNAARYAKLADEMLSSRFEASLDNLRKAVSGGWLSGGRRLADQYLSHLRHDLEFALVYRVRAHASTKAAELLHRIMEQIGQPQGLAEDGSTIWSGSVSRFMAGRKAVESLYQAFQLETESWEDAANRSDASYSILKGHGDLDIPLPESELREWADDAFRAYGGSREIFSKLETEHGRLEIFGELRSVAGHRLRPVAQKLPRVCDVLKAMPAAERRNHLERAVIRAMPWIDADLQRMEDFSGDQFKLIVAVNGRDEFSSGFGHEVRRFIPAGMKISEIEYVEIETRGRLIVYCELSGIPLDLLNSLRSEWRLSYLAEQRRRDGFPLHTHEDLARFPHPIAPGNQELDDMRARLDAFLRGVVFGLLRRRSSGRDQFKGYQLQIARGDWETVGSERFIRSIGFDSSHLATLQQQIASFEEELSPLQNLALSALLGYTAERSYARRLEHMAGGRTRRRGGILHRIALDIAESFRRRFDESPMVDEVSDPGAVESELSFRIDDWTREISGSEFDPDPLEANRDPDDEPDKRARPKRTINPVVFANAERLRELAGLTSVAEGAPPTTGPPPLRPVAIYAALDGVSRGPFDRDTLRELVSAGKISDETLVWREGMSDWARAETVPEVAALLDAKPPATPPPLPSPTPDDG